MKILILSIVMCIVNCCKPPQQSEKPCKGKLINDLQLNWQYNSSEQHYTSNNSFMKRLDSLYKSCLLGKDTSFISKTFGCHYSISKKTIKDLWFNTMEYRLSKPCAGSGNEFHCEFLYFYFDNKHTIIKVRSFILMQGIYH